MKQANDSSVSLNKYISSSGICSRREADMYIEQECVTINGKPANKGNRVYEGDEVRVDGRLIKQQVKPLYMAFNKPVGVVCTTDLHEPDNIISYINHPQKIFPIGRLDKPSEGLIFLTNDGDIVNKILRAGNNHEKEYIVTVDKPVTPEFVKRMSSGVKILGTITQPCTVSPINELTFKIVLTQGLNRQIRRMCEQLGYRVTKLKRTRIMNVPLGKLPVGAWRPLTNEEVQQIKSLTRSSSKTEEASKNIRKKPFKKAGAFKKEGTFKKADPAAKKETGDSAKSHHKPKSKGPRQGKSRRR